MLGLIQTIWLKKSVELLAKCTLIFCILLFSLITEANGRFESYDIRPDILSLTAKRLPERDPNWEALKTAHYAFVAEMLELYPGRDLYFLARDSEHLYDVARLVTAGTPDAARIHLLNVSRGNMQDPNLRAYLAQNGISEESLASGKRPVFIDTGFSGTIPRVIGRLFSEEARNNLKTHLIVSSNPDHPASRIFLGHLNPTVNETDPASMHGTIVSYEHMPRYTDRSSSISELNGRMHAMSSTETNVDGSVSKSKSKEYMEDLKASWNDNSVKQFYRSQRQLWRRFLNKASGTKANLVAEISRKLSESQGSEHRVFESMVRDFIEAQRQSNFDAGLSLFEVGLKVTTPLYGSKKNELIAKFPQWAVVLENPDAEIPKLFAAKNWQMVGNLIDANVDSEINLILGRHLFDGPATGAKANFQMLMIENSDRDQLSKLIEKCLRHERRSEMTDVILAISRRLLVLGEPYKTELSNKLYDLFSLNHRSGVSYDIKPLHRVLMELVTNGEIDFSDFSFVKRLEPVLTSWANISYGKPDQLLVENLIRKIILETRHSWNIVELRGIFRAHNGAYTTDPAYQKLGDAVTRAVEIRDDQTRQSFLENLLIPHSAARSCKAAFH